MTKESRGYNKVSTWYNPIFGLVTLSSMNDMTLSLFAIFKEKLASPGEYCNVHAGIKEIWSWSKLKRENFLLPSFLPIPPNPIFFKDMPKTHLGVKIWGREGWSWAPFLAPHDRKETWERQAFLLLSKMLLQIEGTVTPQCQHSRVRTISRRHWELREEFKFIFSATCFPFIQNQNARQFW